MNTLQNAILSILHKLDKKNSVTRSKYLKYSRRKKSSSSVIKHKMSGVVNNFFIIVGFFCLSSIFGDRVSDDIPDRFSKTSQPTVVKTELVKPQCCHVFRGQRSTCRFLEGQLSDEIMF